MDKYEATGISVMVLALVLVGTFWGSVLVIAWHFIAKYW